MISKKNIILFLFLLVVQNSFTQKKADYYLMKSLFQGVSFHHTDYDIVFNDENRYLEFRESYDSLGNFLLQAKIFQVEKKNNIFLVIAYTDDMQCSWYTFSLYEIEKQTDSLIQIPFHSLIPQFSSSEFIDTVKIKKEIYPKYEKELAEYLGEENPFQQFLEELYDITYVISEIDHTLTATLHYCDYMPVNIVGFAPEDEKFLNTFTTIKMEFDWEKGVFLRN